MNELVNVFRMNEIKPETRASIIIKLGKAINDEHGMNLTEPLVYELVMLLCPDHKIKNDKYYTKRL